MPYYRQLAAAKNSSGAHVPLEVISLDRAEDVKALLSAEHVAWDGAYQLPKRDPALTGTPTLLVADSQGIIRKAYIGKLGPAQEVQFLGILASGSI